MTYTSPLLALADACPAPEGSTDAGVAWHYGDPHGEQRLLASGGGWVDRSHRGVVTVSGPDRLSWLHSLTTQHVEALAVAGHHDEVAALGGQAPGDLTPDARRRPRHECPGEHRAQVSPRPHRREAASGG